MSGEPEVVVRCERKARAPLIAKVNRLGAFDLSEISIEVLVTNRLEGSLEMLGEGVHAVVIEALCAGTDCPLMIDALTGP